MTKKTNIKKDRALEEMESLLKSIPGLEGLIQSLESTAKEAEISEEYQKIKLPYVSAEPIRRTEWCRK